VSRYPVDLEIDPALSVARWRPLLNWMLAAPAIVWGLVLLYGTLFVAVVSWLWIVLTGRMPECWGEYQVGVLRYYWRCSSFVLGFTTAYPALAVSAGYVDPGDLPSVLYSAEPLRRQRLSVAFRAVLLLPHLLLMLWVFPVLGVLLFLGWWGVLLTGRWPSGYRTGVIHLLRWTLQVTAYGLLVVDTYPRLVTDFVPEHDA
jgi:Domain of unknown function (DUF4389)